MVPDRKAQDLRAAAGYAQRRDLQEAGQTLEDAVRGGTPALHRRGRAPAAAAHEGVPGLQVPPPQEGAEAGAQKCHTRQEGEKVRSSRQPPQRFQQQRHRAYDAAPRPQRPRATAPQPPQSHHLHQGAPVPGAQGRQQGHHRASPAAGVVHADAVRATTPQCRRQSAVQPLVRHARLSGERFFLRRGVLHGADAPATPRAARGRHRLAHRRQDGAHGRGRGDREGGAAGDRVRDGGDGGPVVQPGGPGVAHPDGPAALAWRLPRRPGDSHRRPGHVRRGQFQLGVASRVLLHAGRLRHAVRHRSPLQRLGRLQLQSDKLLNSGAVSSFRVGAAGRSRKA